MLRESEARNAGVFDVNPAPKTRAIEKEDDAGRVSSDLKTAISRFPALSHREITKSL